METKIIAIEGIDGSGKTVQFKRLVSRLTALGKSVDTRSFPVYDAFFGKQVGKLLSGEDGVAATDVDQKSMALWYALDRWEAFCGWQDGQYDYLVINRYVMSNAVYQSIRERDLGNPDIMDWVFDLEYEHFRLPRPSVNIFFDVECQRAGINVDRKGFRDYVGDGRDVYEKSVGLQERAREMYLTAAQRYDDMLVIRCMDGHKMRSAAAIADDAFNGLAERGLV